MMCRADQCKTAIGTNLILLDRFGQEKANPLLNIERAARGEVRRILAVLGVINQDPDDEDDEVL